jgi:hypothetical protein
MAPVSYVGCGVPKDLPAALAGEAKTVAIFEDDCFGNGEALLAKRRSRNPFGRQHAYSRPWCHLLAW